MKNSMLNLLAVCFVLLACATASAQVAPPSNGGNGNVMGVNDQEALAWKKKVAGIDWNREIWQREEKMAAELANPTGDNAKIDAVAIEHGYPTMAQSKLVMHGLFTPTGNAEADVAAYAAAKEMWINNYPAEYDAELQSGSSITGSTPLTDVTLLDDSDLHTAPVPVQ